MANSEIVELKQQIQELHNQSNALIMGREDILAPLDDAEMAIFSALNSSCADLQQTLKHEILRNVEKMPEREIKDIRLSQQEDKLLAVLLEYYPTALSAKALTNLISMKAYKIREHLKALLVSGVVVYEADTLHTSGYKIASDKIKESLSLRKTGGFKTTIDLHSAKRGI